ncbi:MAG TPA: hypothetical protein VMN39_08930, partial [Longimicrobiaceae bacterium]|nr:hypothetical protein [Longimicrobiaceae bacterium]
FAFRFPRPDSLEGLGIPVSLVAEIHERVSIRLAETPVQDLRIDFEDGSAPRSEDAEDEDSVRCGRAMAEAGARGELPAGWGLRIRSAARATRARALRTLDRFVESFLEHSGKDAFHGFVVTLAKVIDPAEVEALASHLGRREREWGLAPGSVRLELMAETPESIVNPRGRVAATSLLAAAGGRCVGIHLGVYDYTASLGVVAALQGPRHPLCDFARQTLQVALAGSGVELSDGSPRVLPAMDAEGPPTPGEREVVADVRHALEGAVYRGWDLSPSHTVLRAIAGIAFFREHLPQMEERMRRVRGEAGEGADADLEDAATHRALREFFDRARENGALD